MDDPTSTSTLTETSGPPTSRRRAGLIAAGITVLACGAWLAARPGGSAKGAAAGKRSSVVPVGLASAERRDVPVYLNGLGTVTAFNTVTVRSRVDGQIVRVAFREGQEVNKGDLLIVVDPRPFEVQLEQAQANLVRDQAQLGDARRNYDRFKDLHTDGILPQQQLDSQRSLVQQFEAAIQVDQSQIDNAKLQLSYCHITAPVPGRVGLKLVDEGNMVRAGDQSGLLVLTQIQPIAVVFTLPEDALQVVSKQLQRGPLTAEAWSRDDRTQVAAGTLLTIDNQIDTSTGTGRLKALFDNKDRALWPNQFVNVHLLVEVRKGRTVVPSAAVQRGPEGSFAYVMKTDHTIEVRPVKVGSVQNGLATMDEGLEPGDQVVVDGQEKVQAGTQVEPRAEKAKQPTVSS
jgi:multidrug efflux system membrane fusion protein